MKIAFLLRLWPVFGGGETVTISLANEFIKREMEVYVLYLGYNERKDLPYINEKVKAIQVSQIKCDINKLHFSKEETTFAIKYLQDFVNKNKIDIVINQWWPSEATKGLISMCGVIKCLHMSLFLPSNYSHLKLISRNGYKKLLGPTLYYYLHKRSRCRQVEYDLQYCDKYIFLAPSFMKDYIKFRNANQSTINKLDYCYNPNTFDKTISTTELTKKENIVLFVGRMSDSHKNVSAMLRIWKNVEQTHKFNNWKFILVGDGKDLPIFKQKAQDLKLKNIEFTGQKYPLEYYNRAKLFLMTSTHEGWGMTLVESQQCGTVPIVMDTFSSLHEIIQNRENGIIVPMNDEQTFEQELINVMSNDDFRIKMASKGLETCKRFSIEKVANRWENIFQNIKKS